MSIETSDFRLRAPAEIKRVDSERDSQSLKRMDNERDSQSLKRINNERDSQSPKRMDNECNRDPAPTPKNS